LISLAFLVQSIILSRSRNGKLTSGETLAGQPLGFGGGDGRGVVRDELLLDGIVAVARDVLRVGVDGRVGKGESLVVVNASFPSTYDTNSTLDSHSNLSHQE
jgi:hypothetical protein